MVYGEVQAVQSVHVNLGEARRDGWNCSLNPYIRTVPYGLISACLAEISHSAFIGLLLYLPLVRSLRMSCTIPISASSAEILPVFIARIFDRCTFDDCTFDLFGHFGHLLSNNNCRFKGPLLTLLYASRTDQC